MKTLILLTVLVTGCAPLPGPKGPACITYAPLRNIGNIGPVVTDIESHLPASHPYRDRDLVTWVHEGSHGIAGQLRNLYHCPGFYVLRDRAVLLQEPNTTLSAVAARVPASLRGRGYNLYLIQQQHYFQDQPTYILDEWVAYTNGSEARARLSLQARGETVESMMEFIPYALCLPMDPQLKAFVRWQIERAVRLGRVPDALQTSPDAESLRQSTRKCFGTNWTLRVLGF